MPSEKEQVFSDKKQINLLKHNAANNFFTDTTLEKALVNDPLCMMTQPAILDINLSYGIKNVKIDLPKVNIPNEVLMKHEVDRFRKLFQCKQQTARKSLSLEKINGSTPSCSEGSHLQNKPEVQFEEGLKTTAKILNFTCTKCKDNIRYSPNDLQKHFQLLHYGELPLYPCEMCNFSANDFQSFKQHRRTHRSTLVRCELCNDEHMYTLLDLTKHFTSKHCVNGHFQCEICGFSTQDVGTFVQHIHRHNEIPYKCGKCHYVSFTKEEFQKHHLAHSSMFPYGCQYCSYSTPRKDYLLKHIIALHSDHLYAKEKLENDKCEKRIVKTPAGLKLVLRRYKMGASKKAFWRRKKVSSGSDAAGETNAQVLRSVNKIQTKAEELNQCIRDVEVNEKDQITYTEKHNFTDGMLSATTAQYNKADDGTSYGLGLLKNAVHGPTVLMVKNNKISVPANYSAKFMGFKMVDGKQHIVIKLLPTSKQNLHLLGQKADPIKDGSTTPLLQTADPCDLSSGAIPHVTDQSTLKNSSVHPLTSPPFSSSAPHSGKTKVEKQNNSLFHSRSVSQTVAPSNVAVGKSSNSLPMKLGSTVPPCDEVTKVGTRSNISWGSYSPSHPQVLPPTIANTLHYDPMKMPFFPELKMQNGGLNSSNGTNNFYYSTSVDSSNEGLLSFHNYSKMDNSDNPCSIWMSSGDRYKDFISSKTASFQNSRSESASSFSESMKGLKPEKAVSAQTNINKTYGHINTTNNSESSKSQSKCVVDSECFTEDQHNGRQYLDANIHQGFENVAEKFQENASDDVNSVLMPKITSVFSLQSEQAANYLSPEINQLLQDVLKVKATTQQESPSKSNNCVKLHSDKLLSGYETGNKAFTHLKSSATACGFQRSPSNVGFHLYNRELNAKCSTNEGTHYGRERQTPRTSFDSQGMDKLSRTPGVGTLLKTHTDAIVTQQLVKDKMLSTTPNPSSFSPVLREQKKTLLVQSPPSGFFVPLHLANQPGLQVVSGKSFPSTSLSDGHVTKGVPTSFVLNKGPGMILTFSGAIGTVANAPSDRSQVSGRVVSREYGKITIPASKVEGKNDSFGSGRSSCNRTTNDSLNSVPCKGPLVITNSSESAMKGISSVKVLPEHRDAVFGSLESVNQQELKQKQHVYALLPDGQQAVFLKCMTPNKPVVHKHSVFQDNSHYQNCQPKKTGAMQQKLLLKIKTSTSDTLADTTQSVSNSVPSLQLDNLQSLTPALAQKQTNLSSNDALILPGSLMPANASLANSNPACRVPPAEPVYSTESAGTRLQKGSVESTQVITANNRNNFGSQKSTWSTRNRTAKVKPRLKQTVSKSSETVGVQRSKNFKRKSKVNSLEPPRKKVILHRKCKEKNQAEVVSESGGLYTPRASKETVRTLKLLPFNSKQLVKCPRRNQPVVVLNHPDADVPEVVNVMKTIAKFKGHVLKVSLSKRTIEALLQPAFCNPLDVTTDVLSQKRHRTVKPISPVKERFVLKLTLKKTSKNNYQIVKTTSDNTLKAKFSCWFCGRIFDNQDNWVGHGQRHLMEATRDWNSLM
ncbi:zinc finger protein 518A [Athene cunicularia]|uniref:Zinc finger protein 518A n=1 Tax=Athene cunicularia TaxID=194338 RepID=A0A663M9W3_ATHCN|nr:zinc finger protein 518A [Athene cunicularia]XP_026707234.1 zinc finger protein 518A [Athene cunicularia]XP_026707235.1 zinc finger protein 518A [Athene cunicularia]